jgi:hypothetical protein
VSTIISSLFTAKFLTYDGTIKSTYGNPVDYPNFSSYATTFDSTFGNSIDTAIIYSNCAANNLPFDSTYFTTKCVAISFS